MSQPVDTPVQPVSTTERRTALEHALHRHFDAQRRITQLGRRPLPNRSSFALEHAHNWLSEALRLAEKLGL